MKLQTLFLCLLVLVVSACSSDDDDEVIMGCEHPPINQFYSDYYVFIADDDLSETQPLVVPMDFNWNRVNETEVRTELKSWYGIQQDWAIRYLLETSEVDTCLFPDEIWQLPVRDNFSLDEVDLTVTTTIDNAPELTLQIKDRDEWVSSPSDRDGFITYAYRTSLDVAGETREGWLLYERIRRSPSSNGGGGNPDFAAFYWMPLVIDGDLYQFIDHRGEQSAVRWIQRENGIEVETLDAFDFEILSTTSDEASGRSAIVQSLRIAVNNWDIDLSLESTGAQVGYGDSFPNGLAYYRQSLLEPADASMTRGYGMLELILEDD